MKTRALKISLLALLMHAVSAGLVGAQQDCPTCAKISDCSKYYDAALETAVTGTVQEVVRIPYGKATHAAGLIAVRVATPDGSLLAYLGPESYLRRVHSVPQPGDALSLVAAPIRVDGERILVVRRFTMDQDKVALRGSDGQLLPVVEDAVAQVTPESAAQE